MGVIERERDKAKHLKRGLTDCAERTPYVKMAKEHISDGERIESFKKEDLPGPGTMVHSQTKRNVQAVQANSNDAFLLQS